MTLAKNNFNASILCICGHPQYEHHSVRWFVPVDKMEITHCEHTLLKPKQLCECPQFQAGESSPNKNT